MAITIPKKLIKDDDIVIIPRKEYEEMMASMIPSVYLKGRAAKRLDKLMEDGLREYREGKTEPLGSFLKREYPKLHRKYAHWSRK